MSQSFEEQLRRLAEVTVRVGVGLQPGQKLFINANLEARPLTRRVVEEAYKAGSRLVVTRHPVLRRTAQPGALPLCPTGFFRRVRYFYGGGPAQGTG
ncbi:aminopeptidase [Meiothermus ruber]|uniref:aminopeptidase n=1 Tax=Meiothermus ruber TaxID=277 RepID=UPI000A5850F3